MKTLKLMAKACLVLWKFYPRFKPGAMKPNDERGFSR